LLKGEVSTVESTSHQMRYAVVEDFGEQILYTVTRQRSNICRIELSQLVPCIAEEVIDISNGNCHS
jgi:hypothetical protein